MNFQEMELLNRQMLETERYGGTTWPNQQTTQHTQLTGGDFTSGEGWE